MRVCGLLLAVLCAAGPGAAAVAAGAGNPTNDSLLAMAEKQRVEMLGKMVRHNCVGTEAFFMGVTATGRARGTAYWSVACENGTSFVVQISPDKKGTAIAVSCRVLEGTGRECFQRF